MEKLGFIVYLIALFSSISLDNAIVLGLVFNRLEVFRARMCAALVCGGFALSIAYLVVQKGANFMNNPWLGLVVEAMGGGWLVWVDRKLIIDAFGKAADSDMDIRIFSLHVKPGNTIASVSFFAILSELIALLDSMSLALTMVANINIATDIMIGVECCIIVFSVFVSGIVEKKWMKLIGIVLLNSALTEMVFKCLIQFLLLTDLHIGDALTAVLDVGEMWMPWFVGGGIGCLYLKHLIRR